MPTPTYTALANITLTGNDSLIEFASIPNSFKDLVLVYTAATDANNRDVRVRCNGVSTQSYPVTIMSGSGSSTFSAARTSDTGFVFHYYGDSSTTVNAVPVIAHFLDYSSTDKEKVVLSRASNAANGLNVTAGRFASTNAITSISIQCDTGTFVAGMTASLFGIVS